MNVLNFYLDRNTEDLNLDDFFLILAMQLFEYKIYITLKRNKRILTRKIDIDETDKDNRLELFYREVDEIKEHLSSDDLKKILEHLFPILKYHKYKNPLNIKYYKYLESKHKIGSQKHFDKYFTLTLEENEVSAKTFFPLIYSNDESNINAIFNKPNNKKYNDNLFGEFIYVTEDIPKENSKKLLYKFFEIGDELNLNRHSRSDLNESITMLFRNLENNDESVKIFKKSINFENNMYTISDYLHQILIKNKNARSEEDLIFQDQLEEFKELVCKKIKKCGDNGLLFKHTYVSTILSEWNYFENDKTLVKKYVIEKTNNNDNLIEFLKNHNKIDIEFYDIDDLNSVDALDYNPTKYFETLKEKYFEDLVKLNERVENILNDETISVNHEKFCEKFIENFKNTPYFIQNK